MVFLGMPHDACHLRGHRSAGMAEDVSDIGEATERAGVEQVLAAEEGVEIIDWKLASEGLVVKTS